MKKQLRQLVESDAPLSTVVDELRRLRNAGLTQDEARAALEELRRNAPDEAAEDRILEMLDFVTGFCSPARRVWS
jgi:ferric-dicitrate binding protein FerR (iron transport regulator)